MDGHRQIVAFLFPGDTFGCCIDARVSSAEAVTDVQLTRYALQSVMELSTRSTEVVFNLLRAANHMYGDLAHHVEQVAHLPAAERVLWFFTWLACHQGRAEGAPVELPMNRRDIGDFLGLAPETLSRIITDLKDSGVLSVQGRRSFVLHRTVPAGEPAAPQMLPHARTS